MPAPRATLLFLAILVAARPAPAAGAPGTFDRSHATFTEILQRHVVDGLVGSVAGFVAARAGSPLSDALTPGSIDVEFETYDWSLNDRRAFAGPDPTAGR